MPVKTEISLKLRPTDNKPKENTELNDFEIAAEDILHAIHQKDVKGLAAVLKSAFELADQEPHLEGPHLNEE